MKRLLFAFLLIGCCFGASFAQGKGIDQQNDRIRDAGNDRTPAVNGGKQDTGAGRGIDFGRGRTAVTVALANPYRFALRRDAVVAAVESVLQDRKIMLDAARSNLDQGAVVTQPYIFANGAVVARSEVINYTDFSTASSRGWTRGRYTLTIDVQPIDGTNTNVTVLATVQGRTADGMIGSEWVNLTSNGRAEQEFLRSLITKLTGETAPTSAR